MASKGWRRPWRPRGSGTADRKVSKLPAGAGCTVNLRDSKNIGLRYTPRIVRNTPNVEKSVALGAQAAGLRNFSRSNKVLIDIRGW
jgi:hypothetical protein